MATTPPPSSLAWETIESQGRSSLRTSLPGSPRPELPFTIANPLADRYEVVDLFAPGESTVLLAARDRVTGNPVLIKAVRYDTLPPPPPTAPNEANSIVIEEVRRARHLLQTERRLLVRLRNAGCSNTPHPNDFVFDRNPTLEAFAPLPGAPAVPFDDAFVNAEPYLILEHVAGTTVEELIATEFPDGMDEPSALALLLPVVRVLDVLQQPWRLQGGRTWHCVYQDLKPANILVDPFGRPVLIDFGGCQIVVDGVPVLEGASTPGYAPPEAIGGPARVLLACADVYTIGSTLFHMLSGTDPRDLLARWRGEPGGHLNPRALPRTVSTPVRQFLERCLAPRPSDRLADAGQAAAILSGMVPS